MSLLFFLLDQLSKLIVLNNLHLDERRALVPGLLGIVRQHNGGGLLGYLHSEPGLRTPVFVVVPLAAIGMVWWCRLRYRHRSWGLGLALAGLLGNLSDRIRLGYVIDFISLRGFPTFNLADACLLAAIALLIRDSGALRPEIFSKKLRPLADRDAP